MPALTPANIFFYTAQVSVLVVALAAALKVLRPSPAFRLAACRVLVVALLVLPWQPTFRTVAPAVPTVDVPAFADSVAAGVTGDDAWRPVWWRAAVLWALGGGVLLRGLWLLGGLFRLRRYVPPKPDAIEPDDVAALQAELGTSARVCFVERVAQPVTFGVAPPIVLLPAALASASADERRAILCHELLHVHRRDWLSVLAEEAVLTLLWFNPAVWWLVGELQLAREQVVDRLTVAATGARRAYMDALFSAADAPSAPPLLAGFLRRRHLARRLIALTEEIVMSRARLAVGGVLVLGVLLGSGAAAVAAWPLAAAQVSTAPGDAAAAPGQLAVAHRVALDVPGGLSQELTGATILFDLVVDAQGEVTSARPVSFAMRNDANGLSFSATDLTSVEPLLGRITAGSMTATGPSPGRMFPNGPAMVRDLDVMLKAASAALTQWRFAPPAAAPAIARVPAQFDLSAGQATAGRVEAISGFAGTTGAQMSTFVARSGPPSDDGALRVGGVIKPPTKIVNVNPVYPQEAQDAKVQGVVIIETVIDEAGAVKEAWVLKSVPLLDEPALEAVRHWRYEPTLMNGVPRSVRMVVTVNFTLAP